MKSTLVLYEGKRIWELEGIYSDDYGLTLKDYKWKRPDLNSIQLDKQAMNKILKILIEHKVTNTIIQRNIVENKMFKRMYY